MAVGIYARTSSDEQVDDGTIETQLDYARRHAELNGFSVYKVYADDGVSGTLPLADRPGGAELLKDAKAKRFDTVLVYKLDRFGRSPRNILNDYDVLEKLGVALKSMTQPFDTSTPFGQAMMQMIAVMAGWERSNILERMAAGKQRVAKEGKWPEGRAPFGYQIIDRRVEIQPEEAAVVRYIFNLYLKERLAMAPIVQRLIDEGIPSPWTKRGYSFVGYAERYKNQDGRWHVGGVRQILSNFAYTGTYTFRKSNLADVLIATPPLIDLEDWQWAQRLMRDNQLDAVRNRTRVYVLSRIIKCGLCGYGYTGAFGGTRGAVPYYRCSSKTTPGRAACASPFVKAEPLEQRVWLDILEWIKQPGDVLSVYSAQHSAKHEDKDALNAALVSTEAELTNTREGRQIIIDLLRKGMIDDAEAMTALDRHRQDVTRLEARQTELYNRFMQFEVTANQQSQLAQLRLELQSRVAMIQPGTVEQRELVRALVQRITIFPKRPPEITYLF